MTKRILVVEDQEDLRDVLRTLLMGSGDAVIEASNGEVGVAMAKSERPDLILMDIQMPVLDGYDATRQIKADRALKSTPLIAVRWPRNWFAKDLHNERSWLSRARRREVLDPLSLYR